MAARAMTGLGGGVGDGEVGQLWGMQMRRARWPKDGRLEIVTRWRRWW
jgi:hypothetical protein